LSLAARWRLAGACIRGHPLAFPFFGSAPAEHSSVPAAWSNSRRAQRPSRMAGTPTSPLAPPLPGHALTAVSTTASWRGTRTQDRNQARCPSIAALV